MLRQSSASARQPMLDLARAFEDEIEFLEQLRGNANAVRQLLQTYDEGHPEDTYQMFGDMMLKARTSIDRGLRELQTIKARHPTISDAYEARRVFIEATINLEVALENFDLAYRCNTGQVVYEYGEIEMSSQDIRTSRRAIGKARIAWSAALSALRKQLIRDVEAAWSQVRALEAQALKS